MYSTFSLELRLVGHQGPECGSASFGGWLAEVREMRARVMYEQGRRPFFRLADGGFNDPDPVDLKAYHIIARSQSRAIACARLVPLAVESGFLPFTIGAQRFRHILRDLGTARERACEASRWAVVPEWRGKLGPRIVAAAGAVARWLALDSVFVLACTCRKQDLALMRLGARAIEGLPLFASRISDEDLRLLYFDVSQPSAWMREQMIRSAKLLNLAEICHPRLANPDEHVRNSKQEWLERQARVHGGRGAGGADL
jgi:hypothetical protein